MGRVFVATGACGLLLGALLPLATYYVITGAWSSGGYWGYGMYTSVIGLVLLIIAVGAKRMPGKLYAVSVAVLSVVTGIILLLVTASVAALASETSATGLLLTSFMAGMLTSVIGALLALVSGLMPMKISRR